jgi:hypothetical protein
VREIQRVRDSLTWIGDPCIQHSVRVVSSSAGVCSDVSVERHRLQSEYVDGLVGVRAPAWLPTPAAGGGNCKAPRKRALRDRRRCHGAADVGADDRPGAAHYGGKSKGSGTAGQQGEPRVRQEEQRQQGEQRVRQSGDSRASGRAKGQTRVLHDEISILMPNPTPADKRLDSNLLISTHPHPHPHTNRDTDTIRLGSELPTHTQTRKTIRAAHLHRQATHLVLACSPQSRSSCRSLSRSQQELLGWAADLHCRYPGRWCLGQRPRCSCRAK